MGLELVFCDLKPALVDCWKKYTSDLPEVEVVQGSIFDVACDALVSPANSFGFMDGGLDLAISNRFGWQVQERLQERIRTHHHGELLVGQAEPIATDDPTIPWVIAAPTMRVPMILGASVNPYLALRAVLLLVLNGVLEDGRAVGDVIKRVAIPGLGTGVGGVPSGICARQMRVAVVDVLQGKLEFPQSWSEAKHHHEKLTH